MIYQYTDVQTYRHTDIRTDMETKVQSILIQVYFDPHLETMRQRGHVMEVDKGLVWALMPELVIGSKVCKL